MKSEEVLAVVKKRFLQQQLLYYSHEPCFLVETHNLIQSCMKVKYTPLKGLYLTSELDGKNNWQANYY